MKVFSNRNFTNSTNISSIFTSWLTSIIEWIHHSLGDRNLHGFYRIVISDTMQYNFTALWSKATSVQYVKKNLEKNETWNSIIHTIIYLFAHEFCSDQNIRIIIYFILHRNLLVKSLTKSFSIQSFCIYWSVNRISGYNRVNKIT